MKKVLADYFSAWKEQDTQALRGIFSKDSIYRVKPFGIEEYHGLEQIISYWNEHPVGKQVNPEPRLLNSAFGDNICFAEWENKFTTHSGTKKTTRGMLLLEFENGLIKELREHYLSIEAQSL